MRILIAGITYHPAINGQAIFTVNLAEGLAQKCHEVLVVTQSNQSHPYFTVRNSVQIHAISSISLGIWYPGAYYSLFPGKPARKIFNNFRPDIVHIQDHYSLSRVIAKLARDQNIKVIGTNHFMPENLAPYMQSIAWFQQGFNWLLWRWMLDLFNRLDLATAPSRTAAGILRREGLTTPVFPVSCGVDLDRFHPDPDVDRHAVLKRYGANPTKTTFLFVGRVDGEKRIDLLLQALHQLKRDDLQLVVAGKGAARSSLIKQSKELNLENQIYFPGFVPDDELPALLNSADIFTMPSQAELLSIATLEAMACGRPILAARAQALPELVDTGINGYLFEDGSVDDLARHISKLADQRACWPDMQAASLQRVQAHGLENTLKRYEDIYETALTSHSIQLKTSQKSPVKKSIRKAFDSNRQ
jgi:1,2-diacylglycerol 3-alpha-glucosyltransferase